MYGYQQHRERLRLCKTAVLPISFRRLRIV